MPPKKTTKQKNLNSTELVEPITPVDDKASDLSIKEIPEILEIKRNKLEEIKKKIDIKPRKFNNPFIKNDTPKKEEYEERYAYKPTLEVNTIYVHPNNHKTSDVMTMFEYAEVIGIRAVQISNGSPVFTDVGDLTDNIEIAKLELANKKCPLAIVRIRTTNGTTAIAEVKKVNSLALPSNVV